MSTGITILKGFLLSVLMLRSVPRTLGQELPAPFRQIEYPDAFREGYPMPKWGQGYLVAWKTDSLPTDSVENVALYDRDGKLVGKTRIWLTGASLLRITDAATRKDGNVAVVGYAVKSGGEIAGFLADVSVAHGAARVIQTSPFEGQAVTFGVDGSIWVLGWQVGPGRRLKAAADHNVVEHYGLDDVLQDSHLVRSEFSCEAHPAMRGNSGQPQVLASADRIGLFAPACRLWVELNPAGELLGQWKWKTKSVNANGTDQGGILSVALTSTNLLYARLDSSKDISLVRFDRQSSEWVPTDTITAKSAGAPFVFLEGSDGEALVYLTSGKKLAWSTPKSTAP